MAIKARAFFAKEVGAMTFGTFLTAVRVNMNISQAEFPRRLQDQLQRSQIKMKIEVKAA